MIGQIVNTIYSMDEIIKSGIKVKNDLLDWPIRVAIKYEKKINK